jgi:ankyrin repeat protein
MRYIPSSSFVVTISALQLTNGIATQITIYKYGNKPLHDAVGQDHKDSAIVLLEKGANIEARGYVRYTFIHT